MMKPTLAALVVILAGAPAFAQRLSAEADCTATETELAYDCAIRLTEDGAPVEGAAFAVKADMPEMPMAHNLAPVPAEAGDAPGLYHVRLELEMHGRWTLKLDINAPRRDVVIVEREFLSDGVSGGAHGHGN